MDHCSTGWWFQAYVASTLAGDMLLEQDGAVIRTMTLFMGTSVGRLISPLRRSLGSLNMRAGRSQHEPTTRANLTSATLSAGLVLPFHRGSAHVSDRIPNATNDWHLRPLSFRDTVSFGQTAGTNTEVLKGFCSPSFNQR